MKHDKFIQAQIDSQNTRLRRLCGHITKLCYTVIGLVGVVTFLAVREFLGY